VEFSAILLTNRCGISCFVADCKYREQSPNGKLRLLYECNPIAFLIEQAGGKVCSCDFSFVLFFSSYSQASTGRQRILDLQPTNIHEVSRLLLLASLLLLFLILVCSAKADLLRELR